MISRQRFWLWLLVPAALAVWLLWFAPQKLLGIDTGVTGSAVLVLTGWLGIYLINRAGAIPGEELGDGEQQAWLGFLFLFAICAYLQSHFWQLAQATTFHEDPAVYAIGKRIALMVIGWIVFAAMLRSRRDESLRDERDRVIERKADAFGHGAIVFALVGLIGILGFSPAHRLEWVTPMMIAVILINVLAVAHLLSLAAQIVLYWRDRR